jgi:hypothetical protein
MIDLIIEKFIKFFLQFLSSIVQGGGSELY